MSAKESPSLLWGEQVGRESWIDENTSYHIVNANEVTDDNGEFTDPKYPIIVLDGLDPDYVLADFTGVTLCFDPQFDNWGTLIEITMHVKESGVSTYHNYLFTGEGPYVFCPITPTWDPENDTLVDFYVIIYAAHKANSRLHITSMRFGRAYEMPTDFIRALDITQSCDMTGMTAPFGKMTATISAAGLDVILGYRQQIKVTTKITGISEPRVIGYYYVDSIKTSGEKTYEIIAIDSLGCLASQAYPGHVWNNAALSDVIGDIIGNEYICYTELSTTPTITGLIPECDRRTALLHVAIACGAVIISQYDYLGSFGIMMIQPSEMTYFGTVPKSRTYLTPKVLHEDEVTDYTITTHSFAQNTNGEVAIGNTRYRDTRTENAYTRSVAVGYKTKKTLSQATLVTAGTVLNRVRSMMLARFNRTVLWQGSYVWGDSEEEGRLGGIVYVYDGEGHQLMGTTQKADLHFSGATVKVDAEILSFQILDTPTLYFDEMDEYFYAGGYADEYELYCNGELVATFTDEVYISDPGVYYCIAKSTGDPFAYSFPSNTITIE